MMQILYSIDNLSELWDIPTKHLKNLARLGLLPCIEGKRPLTFDKREIDAWVAGGGLEKHRPVVERKHKGVYEAVKEKRTK